ncbi:MAG: UDP-2,3-diacylglucosamine diphosphatase [Deltaproteobacteria bacterium]|nr:UDP-2,3-diacylglucosamine diphosphatase [Deltaproteobacteria bacterium]
MKAIFVSDVHLKNSTDERSLRFLKFLNETAQSADALFILGDLFDYWLPENPLMEENFAPFIRWLDDYSARSGKIVYLLGNHDFFIGDFSKRRWRAELYSGDCLLNLGGKNVYLAHGDRVYQKDYGYRLLRPILRNRLTRALAQGLPYSLTFKMAQKVSRTSRVYTTLHKNVDCKKIYRDFAGEKILKGADVVILGHNHLPDFAEIEAGSRKGLYINTGDWLTQYSYVTLQENRWELKYWK